MHDSVVENSIILTSNVQKKYGRVMGKFEFKRDCTVICLIVLQFLVLEMTMNSGKKNDTYSIICLIDTTISKSPSCVCLFLSGSLRLLGLAASI